MKSDEVRHNADCVPTRDALLRAKAEALRDFATNVCDRNARYGLTDSARHFGRTYADLLRAEAAVIESVTTPVVGQSEGSLDGD